MSRKHPSFKKCTIPECDECAMRDCPWSEPLHYYHDGCPICDVAPPSFYKNYEKERELITKLRATFDDQQEKKEAESILSECAESWCEEDKQALKKLREVERKVDDEWDAMITLAEDGLALREWLAIHENAMRNADQLKAIVPSKEQRDYGKLLMKSIRRLLRS